MLLNLSKNLQEIYNRADAIIIINKEGIVEYSVTKNPELNTYINDSFIGQHILDVYPSLDENTSNHYYVMKTKKPRINTQEVLTDIDSRRISFINSTFPLQYKDEIIGTIEFSVVESIEYLTSQSDKVEKASFTENFVTQDKELLVLKSKIPQIAKSNASVLIHGETGTGKELIARSIHDSSLRFKEPFVAINCAAIPENLLESTFFGTVKGSFTGAHDHKGIFESANRGTVFLDELNSLNINLQGKILRTIENKLIRPVGGQTEIPIDVRIISAMNEPPKDMIAQGRIRRDLFFRLNVVEIYIPPLRERLGDIELLTSYFMDYYNRFEFSGQKKISQLVLSAFHHYSWPGNVRELRNVIHHGYIMTNTDTISLKDLPNHFFNAEYVEKSSAIDTSLTLKTLLSNYERDLIKSVIRNSENISDASKSLGISRQSLRYKLMKYGLLDHFSSR